MKSHGNRPNSLYASRIPDCERQGVYEFLNPKDKKPFPWKLMSLFRMGNVNEDAFKDELAELGMRIVEDQAPLSEDMRKNYNIGAYMDGKFVWEKTRIPVEMKMMNQFVFDSIDGIDFDEIDKVTPKIIELGMRSMERSPWTRKYLRQGQTYMLGTNSEAMIFALTDGRGGWKFVIMPFDWDKAEAILKVAQVIKSHVEAETYPDRISYDNDICGRCPFLHVCLPDIESNPSLKFIDNPTLVAEIEEWEKLMEKGKRWAKLDKKIKDFVKGNDNLVVGDFLIRDKVGVQKKYAVPPEVKEQYREKDGERHTIKIERIAARDFSGAVLEPGRIISIDKDGDE